MLITCMVPTARLNEILTYLEDRGGDHFIVRPVRATTGNNGEAPKRLSQGEFLRTYFKNNPGKIDLPKFHSAWAKAGYSPTSRHSALFNAVKSKYIKKTAKATYIALVP